MPALALALLLGSAATSLTVELAPLEARPGDAVLVRVRGAVVEPVGALAGRPLAFWRAGDEWRALGGLPIEMPPGPATAVVETPGTRVEAAFAIVEPGFASRTLSVAPKFVEPPAAVRERIAQDRDAFAAAYARPFSEPRFAGGFDWPRRARITSRFGDQRVFNETRASVHYGIDLSGPRGAPVLAANDGEVVLARDAYYSGNSVVLWHGADVFTLYFHLDRIDVAVGARVGKGEQIGLVGSTGRSTGPHLHWSARVGGLLVDPESLLGIDFVAGLAPPRRAGPPAAGSTGPEEPVVAPGAPGAPEIVTPAAKR
jgi:hypothetical protein